MQNHLNDLFRSQLRQKLLRYCLDHPQGTFYVRELAQAIREDPGNCSRELHKLQQIGLITAVDRGTLRLHSVKQSHPDWPKIQEILKLTQPKRQQKTAYFLAGPNGSGKTTLAKRLVEGRELPFLNADETAMRLRPKHLAQVRLQAGKLFLEQLRRQVQTGNAFIAESTFAGRYWQQWIPRLKDKRYALNTTFISVASPEEAVLRIQVRIQKGGHPVPEEDVRRRFHRSKANFWNLYRKEMDFWRIYLNSKDELMLIAYGTAEQTQIIHEKGFQLFKEGIQ